MQLRCRSSDFQPLVTLLQRGPALGWRALGFRRATDIGPVSSGTRVVMDQGPPTARWRSSGAAAKKSLAGSRPADVVVPLPATPQFSPEIEHAHEAAMSRAEDGYTDPSTGLFVFTRGYHLKRGHCCG